MQKTLKLISFLLISFFYHSIYAQYDYGIDVSNKDVKIEGRINLIYGTSSLMIGQDAGLNDDKTDNQNVFIGTESGKENTSGVQNTYIGFWAGQNNEEGISNTIGGYRAGQNNKGSWNTILGTYSKQISIVGDNNTFLGAVSFTKNAGSNNVGIGYKAGNQNESGSGNIFIGYESGKNELGSNRLFIENSDSNSPLIYGEFDNDKIEINGSLHITEFMKLVPGTAPSSPEKGTMYYDSSDDKVKVWTGSWENLFFNNPSKNETSFSSNPCASDCTQALNKSVKKQELLVQENNVLRERLESVESDLQEMKKMIIQIAANEEITTKLFIVKKQSQLEQNVPNPFNGSTKINYYIPPTSQKANLKIFNISGQLVENINIKTFGRGEIELSLEKLKNGLFHYSLEVDGQIIDTKKMTSIK